MIRKATTIFFILLANMILLADTVISHHHHHNDICFVRSHCTHENADDYHDPATHDHEHDGNNSAPCCLLKQAVMIPSNQIRQEIRVTMPYVKTVDIDTFIARLSINRESYSGRCTLCTLDHPVICSLDAIFAHGISGLRAPPMI